jgi:hypothetical protein
MQKLLKRLNKKCKYIRIQFELYIRRWSFKECLFKYVDEKLLVLKYKKKNYDIDCEKIDYNF